MLLFNKLLYPQCIKYKKTLIAYPQFSKWSNCIIQQEITCTCINLFSLFNFRYTCTIKQNFILGNHSWLPAKITNCFMIFSQLLCWAIQLILLKKDGKICHPRQPPKCTSNVCDYPVCILNWHFAWKSGKLCKLS